MKNHIIILAMGLLLAACGSEPTSPEPTSSESPAIPVRVAPVGVSTVSEPVVSSGLLAAKEEVKLSFKVGGILRRLTAEEGQAVSKGQLLARLDPVEIEAQLSQATTAVEKARRDLERAERLYADTVVTLEQVQDLRTALEVAEAQLQIARFNGEQLGMYAPSSGRILKRFAEAGEVISPGSPVFLMASRQGGQVLRVGLADVDVVKIGLGDRAEVAFDAYPGVAFVGQVSEIAAGAEPMSGTFEVEVALEPQEQKLKDGFVGKVQIFPRQGQAQLRIPMDALVEAEPGRALVYVPDADKQGAQPLWLEGYQLREDYILLPRSRYPELKAVVTAGAKYLRADARIRVVAPEGSKSLAVSDRID